MILQTLVTAMNGKNTDPCRFRESSKVEENFILFDKVKQALQEVLNILYIVQNIVVLHADFCAALF